MDVVGMRIFVITLITLWVLIATTPFGSAEERSESVDICPSQQVVFYFLPGEVGLDVYDDALVEMIAKRSLDCLIDRLEVDSFADDQDLQIDSGNVPATRATAVIRALSNQGVAALDVIVRLHNQEADAGAEASARRTVVRIKMRGAPGPMS